MALLSTRSCEAVLRYSRRARWLLALLVVAARCLAGDPPPPSGEYQIKAVFLYNFAQFAEWPATAFATADAPFVIGIVGVDPFGPYLDDVVKDEKVGGRSLVVRRLRGDDDIRGCHILFISRSETSRLARVLAVLRRQSTLTISDADGFTRQGGMVRFVMEAGKVRLRINNEAAKGCGITISSKILRPSTIVGPGKD